MRKIYIKDIVVVIVTVGGVEIVEKRKGRHIIKIKLYFFSKIQVEIFVGKNLTFSIFQQLQKNNKVSTICHMKIFCGKVMIKNYKISI